MKTTTENIAIKAEEQIDLIHKDHKDGYDLPHASLWVLNNLGSMVCRKTHPDVYELLSDEFTVKLVEGYDFFAILTCGWAAPLPAGHDDESNDKSSSCAFDGWRRLQRCSQRFAIRRHA